MDCIDSRLRFCSAFFSSFFSFFFFFVQPAIVDLSIVNSAPVHCSRVPQITLFSNFFIKNGSHNTIYTFKNYFATVFSVSIFSFSKNKFNPNGPITLCLQTQTLARESWFLIKNSSKNTLNSELFALTSLSTFLAIENPL